MHARVDRPILVVVASGAGAVRAGTSRKNGNTIDPDLQPAVAARRAGLAFARRRCFRQGQFRDRLPRPSNAKTQSDAEGRKERKTGLKGEQNIEFLRAENAKDTNIIDRILCAPPRLFASPRWGSCFKKSIQRKDAKGRGERRGYGTLQIVHHSAHAVPHHSRMEIQQQTETLVREAQIRKQLNLVNRGKFLDRLYFDDDQVLDQQIDAIRLRKFHAFVNGGQPELPTETQSPQAKLVPQRKLICALKQPRPQMPVYLDRRPDDQGGTLILIQLNPLRPSAPLCVSALKLLLQDRGEIPTERGEGRTPIAIERLAVEGEPRKPG